MGNVILEALNKLMVESSGVDDTKQDNEIEEVKPEAEEDYYEDDVEFDDYNSDDVPEDDTENLEEIEDSSIEYDDIVSEEDEAIDFINKLSDNEIDAINELAKRYTASVDNYEEVISNAIAQRNELVNSLGYSLKQANWIMFYYLAFKDADEEIKNAISDITSIVD